MSWVHARRRVSSRPGAPSGTAPRCDAVARAMPRSTAAAAARARKKPRAAGGGLAAAADPTATAPPHSGSRCPSSAAVMVITASYQVTALEDLVRERAHGRWRICMSWHARDHKPRTVPRPEARATCSTLEPAAPSTGQQQHKPCRLGGAAVEHCVAITLSVAVSDGSQRCGVCAGYRKHIPRKESAVIPICLGVCGVFRGTLRPRVRARPPPVHVRDTRGRFASRTRGRKYPEIPRKTLESRAIPVGYVAGYRLHISRRYPVIYLICEGFYPAAPRAQANRCACARLRPRQATHDCRRAVLGPWCGMENSLWHRETS